MKQIFRKAIALLLTVTLSFGMVPKPNATVLAASPPTPWDGTVASSYASGSGTQRDPYLISDARELAYLSQRTNSGHSYAGSYFALSNSIDLNGLQWTPINGFSGVFDGRDRLIANLYIDGMADYQALFGTIANAEIKNLKVPNAKVSGGSYCAGVVGAATASSISDCHTDADIYIAAANVNYIGGIVGLASEMSVVDGCSFSGSIFRAGDAAGESTGGIAGGLSDSTLLSSSNSGDIYGMYKTGGLVGSVVVKEATIAVSRIENSINKGTVVGSNAVGGVAGHIATYGGAGNVAGIVRSCNVGSVRGNNYIGGIAGDTSGEVSVTMCYNTGDIEGISFIGGLIGRFDQDTTSVISGIGICYNAGDVSGTGSFVGALIGLNYNTVLRSFFTNPIGGIGLDLSGTPASNQSYMTLVSDEALKGLASELGANFGRDSRNVNKGYPILNGVDYGNDRDKLEGPPDEVRMELAPVASYEARRYANQLPQCEGDPVDVVNGNMTRLQTPTGTPSHTPMASGTSY